MPIMPFPTEDRGQISGFLSSVKEVIVTKPLFCFSYFFSSFSHVYDLLLDHIFVLESVPVCLFLSTIVFTGHRWAGSVLSGPHSLSPHFTLCQPQHSGHFLHSHPLWMAVIIAKLYTHMAGHQPLKPHCNITQRSFNESLTQQRYIKGPSSLSCSEKYSDILVHLFPAFMRPFVCRGT